jgi:DNA polymerase-3 subunit delta
MVAVKRGGEERFIEAPPPSVFLFLLHGADAGLARERALALAAKRVDRRDPFQFLELSGDAVAADPLRLLDEANSVPMFGGDRAILIEAGSKNLTPALEALLSAPPAACSVIVTAGALRKDAALRKLVEGAKFGAAIECQPDSELDLAALIDHTLRDAGLMVTPEARHLLQSSLGEDRMMSRAELEKLVLYLHGRDRVEPEDVEAIVAHASHVATDRLVLQAFSGDGKAVGEELETLVAQGDGPQALMTAMRYALALHRARLAADRDGRVEAGFTALQRAGFGFAHRAMMESHIRLWTAPRLLTLIEELRAAQTRARARSDIAGLETSRALMLIARGGR